MTRIVESSLRLLSRLQHSASTQLRSGCHRQPSLREFATNATAPIETAAFAAETIPLRTGRARLVVLGTGWAAARLLHDIDPNLYDLTVR